LADPVSEVKRVKAIHAIVKTEKPDII
jgi:hypothetical protein